MGKATKVFLSGLLLGIFTSQNAWALPGPIPDPKLTPGTLCTESDPNFDGYRYPEHVPHCRRNVTQEMKKQIGREYGVAVSDFSKYEFDHYLPLGIGGSSSLSNLWPQRKDQADEKDVLEDKVFHELSDGDITQAEAVKEIRDWRPSDE